MIGSSCRIAVQLMFLNHGWPDDLDEIAAVRSDLDGYTGWVCDHAYYQLVVAVGGIRHQLGATT